MTQYYFDYVGGLDANSGLTTGAPKKTLSALGALIAAGNILSLKRGVVWPRTGTFGSGITFDINGKILAGVCTINDYDSAVAAPTIDALEYDNSATGWSHIGSGIWTKTVSVQINRVMFGGSYGALSTGGLARAPTSAVDATKQWFWGSGVLTIYTGSSTVSPPVFYGGLAMLSFDTVMRVRDSANILFERLRFFGGYTGVNFQNAGADVSDITMVDCETGYGMKGFAVHGDSGVATACRRITLTRPVYNTRTDATENTFGYNDSFAAGAPWGQSDGIYVAQNFDNIVVTDWTITGARHTGINIHDNIGSLPGKVTCTAGAAFGLIDSRNINYGRAIGAVGSIAGLDVKISGAKSIGQVTRTQLAGKAMVSGCSWKDMQNAHTIEGWEVSQAIYFQNWLAGPGDSFVLDVTVQNCLIENPWSTAFAFFKSGSTAGTFDANTVKVYNNTIVDVLHYNEPNTDGCASGRRMTFSTWCGQAPPAQLIKNNNLITPSAGANSVRWGDSSFYAINGAAGFSGNVENIEGYVNRGAGDYHPTESGGLKYAGVAGSAFALDLSGLPFNSTPSIAPSEFVEYFNYEDIATMLINGNWLIDQINEGGLYTINAAAVQGPDGWSGAAPASSGVFKVRRLTDPDNAALKCLEITCTTIDASLAASDAYYIHTAIEGYDAAGLMAGTASAQTITISFKFKSNVNGVYGVSVANSALNRSYVGTFTVANANESAYILTLTLDTSGTWLYNNGVGLRLRICLAAGSNFQKTAGAWGTDNMLTTSAQVNFMSNVANIAYLKRIQLLPGSVALPFAPADIQKELAKCQRYYWKTFNQGVAVAQATLSLSGALSYFVLVAGMTPFRIFRPHPVTMRATPTILSYSPVLASAKWLNTWSNTDSGVFWSVFSGDSGIDGYNPQVASDGVGKGISIHLTANARLS